MSPSAAPRTRCGSRSLETSVGLAAQLALLDIHELTDHRQATWWRDRLRRVYAHLNANTPAG